MTKHTPGQFTVGQLCNGTIRIDEPERCAGMVFVEPAALGRSGGLARAEATARLWAASAEMLERLKEFEIVECEECDGSGRSRREERSACRYCGGFGKQLRGGDPVAILAAIAKAEGRG